MSPCRIIDHVQQLGNDYSLPRDFAAPRISRSNRLAMNSALALKPPTWIVVEPYLDFTVTVRDVTK
jgi:hypothetical protein